MRPLPRAIATLFADDVPDDMTERYNAHRLRSNRRRILNAIRSRFLEEPSMVNANGKITHKFYVGANSIINGGRNEWPKKTLKEAIAHATELAEDDGEPHIVVQIVAVVRPRKTPVEVQRVR